MTDPTAAIEVWARMLCAADVHVHGANHPTWQQLIGEPGRQIRDDYRKAAAAIQATIDADRARFPRRSNDRAALGAAREIVLNLIDESSRCTDTAPQDGGESHRLGEQKIREAARWLRADVAFRVLDALDGAQRPAREARQDPTQDGEAFTAIRADELEATAIALEAQTCTCGCRRAADFLRQRAAVTRATTAVARPGQPETDDAPTS